MTGEPIHQHPSAARRIGAVATVAALTMGATAASLPAMAVETRAKATASDQTTRNDTTVAYTVQTGGQTATLTKDTDGTYKGETSIESDGQLPAELTAVSNGQKPTTVKLARDTVDPHPVDYSTVGVAKNGGTAVYTGKTGSDTLTLTISYTSSTGTEVRLDAANGGAGFDKTGTATANDAVLNMDGTPGMSDITLSNGQKLPIQWAADTQSTPDPATGKITTHRDGTATGQITLDQDGANHTWNVTVNIRAVRTASWTASVNGQTKPFPVTDNGLQPLEFDRIGQHPGDMTVTGGDKPITLKPSDDQHKSTPGDLGQMTVTGTSTYTSDGTPSLKATVPYEYTVGSPITIKDTGTAFKNDNGKYTASYDKFTLDTANKPSGSQIELSDGTKATVNWNKTTSTTDKDNGQGGTATFVRLSGTATGTITVTDPATGEKQAQTYTIDVTADRAQDKSFNKLTVTQTNAKGDKTTLDVKGFDPTTHDYKLDPLPYAAIGDAFTLNADTGVDAAAGQPTLTLGDNASRVFHITVNGGDYTVTVPFQSADIKADSPAKLTGIYVNRTGEPTQGDLIDNWDPNRLDYTITLGADEKSPYVLPVAPDGVTISAGDVTQSAQSVKQVWKVTDTDTGQTREYSVTATRPVKTAVTEFKPGDPVKQDSTTEPKDDKDAELASHGYVDKTGEYTPVASDQYAIPEGGVFSYEPKTGQSATVTVTHEAMTYTYTVTVLPKDMHGFPQQHVYKVTYLTAATHLAELTGIAVDGQSVNGFDRNRHEYTVPVNDVDEWVVTPQYDKTTGMTVSTKKDKQDATITVTSGDGLTTATYKLHVTQKPFGGDGTVGVGGNLANTGISMGIVSAIIGVLAVIGGAIYAAGRHAKRKTTPDTDTVDKPTD